MLVELYLPKFLSTDLIDCDINPLYVRFTIKEKITQLRLPEEIEVDKCKVERSKATGHLLVTCPTVRKRLYNTKEYKKQKEEREKAQLIKKLEKEMQERQEEKKEETKKELGKDTSKVNDEDDNVEEEPFVPDFDLDEVPDLE